MAVAAPTIPINIVQDNEESYSSCGCIFPIDMKKLRVTMIGTNNLESLTIGDFVYIPRFSIDSYFASDGEFTYLGDFSLFSTSTNPQGIDLSEQSGAIYVRKHNCEYYTIISSEREIDYHRYLAFCALGREKETIIPRPSRTLLVSARRNFTIEPLQVFNLDESERDSLQLQGTAQENLLAIAHALTAPHPEEKRIMDFYKSMFFEPLIKACKNEYDVFNTIYWTKRDIPQPLRNLDFLHNLEIVKN